MASAETEGSSNGLPPEPSAQNIQTIHQLLRVRAARTPDAPYISYPAFGTHYTTFSTSDIKRFCDHLAARYYEKLGRTTVPADQEEKVVGILGVSNLSYILSVLSLARLGYTVLLLSTRITDAGYSHLLHQTGCSTVFVQPAYAATIARVAAQHSAAVSAVALEDLPNLAALQPEPVDYEEAVPATRAVWIIHSSGSTGLPKPVRQTHRSILNSAWGMIGPKRGFPIFCSLPFNHASGAVTVVCALCAGSNMALHNADIPLTTESMLAAMQYLPPAMVTAVPYAIKLLASTPEGITALKQVAEVIVGGAACPKSLGDRLVAEDVHLCSFYGSTECGAPMASKRDYEKDKDWNWLRPLPPFVPFAQWEPVSDNIYELVVRDGWPSKIYTNREDGGYATRDLFLKHPTDDNKWQSIGRLDDTIVLSNGLKANPVPIELAILHSPLVQDVVVAGSDRSCLSMMVVANVDLPRDEFLDQISEHITEANRRVPAYARIERDAVEILPPGTAYPATDKGNAIRAKFIQQFQTEIDALYNRLEGADFDYSSGLALSERKLRDYLENAVRDVLLLPPGPVNPEEDFFALGLDSLGAMTLWRKLGRDLNTGGNAIDHNIAFQRPTIDALARYLYALRTGEDVDELPIVEMMHELVEKYSNFEKHVPKGGMPDGKYVLVTGATGGVGAHIAAQLLAKENVKKVYCLVRASTPERAQERVLNTLKERKLYDSLTAPQLQKVAAFPTDLSSETLGLTPEGSADILAHLTHVIHCGWAVNFNMDLTSFEAHNIRGTHNLLNFCLKSPHPAPPDFNFCSSVSAVFGAGGPVEEVLPWTLDAAPGMGYAQSKLVTEFICARAAQATGIAARIMRIGQVIGDTQHGIWNASEAVGLTVQAARHVRALPLVPGDERVSWLPVDVCAATVIELALLEGAADSCLAKDAVFGVCHPKPIRWNEDFLPALRQAGLEFQAVPQKEWVRRLKESPRDAVANPAIKLLAFFERKYGGDTGESLPVHESKAACRYSKALREAEAPGAELFAKTLRYWEQEWAKGR